MLVECEMHRIEDVKIDNFLAKHKKSTVLALMNLKYLTIMTSTSTRSHLQLKQF
jgi:hypothetical protein